MIPKKATRVELPIKLNSADNVYEITLDDVIEDTTTPIRATVTLNDGTKYVSKGAYPQYTLTANKLTQIVINLT